MHLARRVLLLDINLMVLNILQALSFVLATDGSHKMTILVIFHLDRHHLWDEVVPDIIAGEVMELVGDPGVVEVEVVVNSLTDNDLQTLSRCCVHFLEY